MVPTCLCAALAALVQAPLARRAAQLRLQVAPCKAGEGRCSAAAASCLEQPGM
jgi:hypothetical protein